MRDLLPIATATFFLHLLLLVDVVPFWLVLAAACAALWKTTLLRRGTAPMPRPLLGILGLMGFSLTLLETPRFWHKETATHLIVIVALMLILDRSSRRQIMLVHASLFALLVALLVAKGPPLPSPVYFALSSLIFISLMLHHVSLQGRASLGKVSKRLLLIALPVATFFLPLYYFFPDIRPSPNDYAVTGLSDSLEPGRIAALARSDRLAFRVRFQEPPRIRTPLYWRASVLEESYGMVWRRKSLQHDEPLAPQKQKAPLVYEILSEPRLGGVLPLLEHTSYAFASRRTETGIAWRPSEGTYRSIQSLVEVGADLQDSFKPPSGLSPPELSGQELPKQSHRLSQWTQRLSKLALAEKIDAVLDHFRAYRYTLEAGLLREEDALDQFLFEADKGYCEHFAAAFASLMQLSGTPARVVTGFQGGQALGGSLFWQIIDSDAHAWTEVWDGQMWKRIDPTLVVPGSQIRSQDDKALVMLPGAWIDYLLRTLGDKLRELTQDIEMVWLLVFSMAGLLLSVQLIRLIRHRRSQVAWAHELQQLLNFARQKGFHRRPEETMQSFLKRLAKLYPHVSQLVREVSELYDEVLYGPDSEPERHQQLKKNLARLYRLIR